MKRSSGPRKTACLSESVHQRLNMYAIAAAVLSLLVLSQPSEARIVYRSADVVISCYAGRRPCYQQYNLDLNHDGVPDFTIFARGYLYDSCNYFVNVGELAASGNGAIGNGGYAAALMQGAPIGHSQQFQESQEGMAFVFVDACQKHLGGPWYNVIDRYLGLEFQINGKTHYGWARLSVQVDRLVITATLTGYAYETIPSKSIKTGQTHANADDPINEDYEPAASLTAPIPDTPQPASLGMFALGAQGLSLWRRKEPAFEGD
jgi:hypothetical protein